MPPSKPKADWCGFCKKRRLWTYDRAISSAIYNAGKFGKTYSIYECPVSPSTYHLTTKGKRHEARNRR